MGMRTAGQVLLLLAGIGMVAVCNGADDDYLKALKAETQALSGGQAAQGASAAAPETKPKDGWSADKQGMGEEMPANLSKEQFEAELKKSFFGTYMFYSKLNDADKTVVYQAYLKNRQISNIRDTTTSLLKK